MFYIVSQALFCSHCQLTLVNLGCQISCTIAGSVMSASANMEEATSALENMALGENEPKTRARRRIRGRNPRTVASLLDHDFNFNQPLTNQQPDPAATTPNSDALLQMINDQQINELRQRMSSNPQQLKDIRRDQKQIRKEMLMLQGKEAGSPETQIQHLSRSRPKRRNPRGAKGISIKVHLHYGLSSATTNPRHYFNTVITARRAQNFAQFCSSVTATFDPLVIQATGESFSLTSGRVRLKETGEKARGDGTMIVFQHCNFQSVEGIYKR